MTGCSCCKASADSLYALMVASLSYERVLRSATQAEVSRKVSSESRLSGDCRHCSRMENVVLAPAGVDRGGDGGSRRPWRPSASVGRRR